MSDPLSETGLVITQLFVLSCVFSHRADVLSLPSAERAGAQSIYVDGRVLQGKGKRRGSGLILRIRTDENEKDAHYQFQVELALVVEAVNGREVMDPNTFITEAGIATLFPFVREFVANLTMRGRFGPVFLNPFNLQIANERLVTTTESERPKKSTTTRAKRGKAPSNGTRARGKSS